MLYSMSVFVQTCSMMYLYTTSKYNIIILTQTADSSG